MNSDHDPHHLRRLKRAVLRLPPRQLEIFTACSIDGLSNEDAAIRFDLSVREVEQLLVRALMNIHRHMDGRPRRRWHRLF